MKLQTTILFLFSCLLFNTCRKDKAVDPTLCDGQTSTSAEFVTGEEATMFDYNNFTPYTGFFQTDTFHLYYVDDYNDKILGGTEIYFKAKEQNATSYKWIVGNDPDTIYKKDFNLWFDKAYGKIPVTLIINKTPVTQCFSNDDGTDTIRKDIFITHFPVDPISGSYLGYNADNPADTFTITIGLYEETSVSCASSDTCIFLGIYNLPKGFLKYTHISTRHTYAVELTNCSGPYADSLGCPIGYAYLGDKKDKIVINYWYDNFNTNTFIAKKFIGFRIN